MCLLLFDMIRDCAANLYYDTNWETSGKEEEENSENNNNWKSMYFVEKFGRLLFLFYKGVLIYHSLCLKNGFKVGGRNLPL